MTDDAPYLTERDVAGITPDGSTKSIEMYPKISALRVCLYKLGETNSLASDVMASVYPTNAVRSAWTPQTIADQIWVMHEFPTMEDRLNWEATLPPLVAGFLDRKVIPHALEFGWHTRDANGWPC